MKDQSNKNKTSKPNDAQKTSESMPSELQLWCLIEGGVAFPVKVEAKESIATLKELIHEKNKYTVLGRIDAKDLMLVKVDIPVDGHTDNTLRQLKFTENEGKAIDPNWQRVSYFWPTQPAADTLHILVKLPAPGTISISHSDCTLSLDKSWALRPTTVQVIHQILNSKRLVQVQGTSGSGKTVLLKLLRNHISKVDPEAVIHVISTWPNGINLASRLSARLPGIVSEVKETTEKTYILFDNGQDTYWDTELWDFFKDHQQRRNGYRIILFCRYGKYAHGKPGLVPPHACISLARQNIRAGCEPVGLLLSQSEFDDVINRSEIMLDSVLRHFILDSTDGHVGAVKGMLETLSWLFKKEPNNVVLTMADFKGMDKSAFWREVRDHPAFGRGIPTKNELSVVGVADIFRDLLNNGRLLRGSENSEAVDWCHKKGWIHADATHCEEQVYYVLPSPLHGSYLSWALMPSKEVSYETVLDLAIAVISAAQLLIQMKGLDKDIPPEAQYQQEFYRGLCRLFGGVFRSPEFGTERGARQSRIDFFINTTKWGIELVRDGVDLDEDGSLTGTHGMWLPTNDMEQYLILDFRRSQPIITHEIPNLYHVVFEQNPMGFKILDNSLQTVHESGIITW